MKHNPHLTAITRKQLPRPTRWLLRNGYLLKHKFIPMLDFGCGKCHSVNNEHLHIDGYDPHFRPDGIPEGKRYQIIVCNYVLCVLPPEEHLSVLRAIRRLLTEHGHAYISVRADKPKQGWGLSSKGTYQGQVESLAGLPVIHENSSWKTFLLTKKSKLV
jgi:hypothetical protein